MARTLETYLVFTCGVMRFDASGNLFVHLTHSIDAPHVVSIDGGVGQQAPPSDRRAKVAGNDTSGSVRGSWPEFTASLPARTGRRGAGLYQCGDHCRGGSDRGGWRARGDASVV